mmetsp:Transcript_18032/g.39329  ORF Transcript_18032/g.39329 Transcript_18032/m.39329 type:complete len:325 (+) Transcript_18032:182-1156(+)
MGLKSDSPKLTPAERLARKRAAARLRQQRCRARKRQAMLDMKRVETDRPGPSKIKIRNSPRPSMVVHTVHHRPQSQYPAYSKPAHSTESLRKPWVGVGPQASRRQPSRMFPAEPIYNCVSFDSQKSLEEVQHNISRASSTPPGSPSDKPTAVVTPSRTPPPLKTIVKVLSDVKKEEPYVSEEEAAVAAMLSLKSGSTTVTETSADEIKKAPLTPPREVMISHESKISNYAGIRGSHSEQKYHDQLPHNQPLNNQRVQLQQQRRMHPRYYEGYNYGPPMKIPPPPHIIHAPPGYYRMHPPVHPPHPHYHRGYFPPAPRCVSYKYK